MAAGLLALPFGTAHAAETPVYDTSQAALAQSQLRDVTGRVTDRATGDPIVGVTVANNSTGSGTVTDAAGAFTVKAATGQLLTISCVGYTSWTVKVPASGAIDVELSEDAQQLDDVVVVGYATQKKINVTGAVSSISGEELAQRPVVSTMQALQGIDPSLNISIDSGNPTAGNSLNIRGVPSINGGSPLILVDGVPGVSLRLVNADIESISVLKDASASAIYGAKASAGVILVTTKKSAAGKATVSYSNNIGWTQPTTPTDFITNGYDYATIVNDLYFSRYAYNAFNYTDADWAALEARRYDTTEHPDRPWVVIGDDGKYHYYGNFDWYHSIYNTNRFHQEHNLSLSGGGKDVNYYVSGRYYQQDGVLGGNMIRNKENYKNYSFRAKFDAQLFKWAKWSTNASLNAVNQKYPGPLNEAQTIAALEENVAPMFVPYNPDGSIVMYPADLRNVALGKGRTAALADPTNKHTIENLSLTLSNSLQLKLHKDLTFDASYNINNYRRLYKDRTAANIYSDAVGVTKTTTHYQKDTYRERPYEYTYHNVDAYFTYEHSWNKEHNFKAVAGMNYEKYRLVDNIVEQFGLGSDQIDSFNSVNDDTYWLVQQDISAYKTLGFFARINYDYKGKYLFEASMRADGTSRFAKKDRWGYFPSVSAGWRFTEERFMEGVRHWWDNGKIRLSYGALGNQQVSNYLYLQTIGTGTLNYLFDDSGKASYASVSDPMSSNLTWETVYTYNLGLDLSFLQNRHNSASFVLVLFYDFEKLCLLLFRTLKGQIADAAFGLRRGDADRELRRPAHQRVGALDHVARPVQAGRQTLPLRPDGSDRRLPDRNHEVQQPHEALRQLLRRQKAGRDLGLPRAETLRHRRGGRRLPGGDQQQFERLPARLQHAEQPGQADGRRRDVRGPRRQRLDRHGRGDGRRSGRHDDHRQHHAALQLLVPHRSELERIRHLGLLPGRRQARLVSDGQQGRYLRRQPVLAALRLHHSVVHHLRLHGRRVERTESGRLLPPPAADPELQRRPAGTEQRPLPAKRGLPALQEPYDRLHAAGAEKVPLEAAHLRLGREPLLLVAAQKALQAHRSRAGDFQRHLQGRNGNGLHHAPHLLVRRRHHLLTTSSRKEYENHL